MKTISQPAPNEYAPFYADYIQRAIAKGDISTALPAQQEEVRLLLGTLSDSQARYRISAEDWSIKELVSHLSDTERVFSYRLLRIARQDKTPLPGFEQEDYVRASGADELPLADLLNEFLHLRTANIYLIQGLSENALRQTGTASDNPVSAKALVFMLVGHVEHHLASLKEKYLPFV